MLSAGRRGTYESRRPMCIIVASPRPRTGKTCLRAALIDSLAPTHGRSAAFDLNQLDACWRDYLPDHTRGAPISPTPRAGGAVRPADRRRRDAQGGRRRRPWLRDVFPAGEQIELPRRRAAAIDRRDPVRRRYGSAVGQGLCAAARALSRPALAPVYNDGIARAHDLRQRFSVDHASRRVAAADSDALAGAAARSSTGRPFSFAEFACAATETAARFW